MQTHQLLPLTCAFFALLISGCSPSPEEKNESETTRKELIRKGAEKHLETLLYNPSTYHYDTLILLDSVLYRENLQNRYRFFKNALAKERSRLLILRKQDKTDSAGKAVKQMEQRVEVLASIVEQLDSMYTKYHKSASPETAAYLYSYRFYGENDYGAVKPFEYYVQVEASDPYRVIRIVNDANDLHPYPNAFPGYDSLQQQYKKQLGRGGLRHRLRP